MLETVGFEGNEADVFGRFIKRLIIGVPVFLFLIILFFSTVFQEALVSLQDLVKLFL